MSNLWSQQKQSFFSFHLLRRKNAIFFRFPPKDLQILERKKKTFTISTFYNQSFANQAESMGEARSFIKINGDSSEAGSLEMSKALAKLSVDGVPAWGNRASYPSCDVWQIRA